MTSSASYPLTNTPILNALFTNDGKTDNGLKAKTNIIRGLQVTNDVATNGNQHDTGFARMFTGAKLMPTSDGAPWGGAASIDQIVANDWKVQSVTTAVYASESEFVDGSGTPATPGSQRRKNAQMSSPAW